MAEEWTEVAPPERQPQSQQPAPSGWGEVTPPRDQQPGPVRPLTAGGRQYEEDVALVGQPSAGKALAAGIGSAAQSAGMNLPLHAYTWYQMGKEGLAGPVPEEREAIAATQRLQRQRLPGQLPSVTDIEKQAIAGVPSVAEDYAKRYAAEKARFEAMRRQAPGASLAGDVAGFVGGAFIPGGPLAKPGQVVESGVTALGKRAPFLTEKGAEKVGQTAGTMTTGAVYGGASTYFDELDVNKALTGAGVSAVTAPIIQKAVSGLTSSFRKYPDPIDPKTGDWSKQASDSIEAAFGPAIRSGELTMADVQSLKPYLLEIFKQKGMNAGTAEEALIRARGLPPGVPGGPSQPTRGQMEGTTTTRGPLTTGDAEGARRQIQFAEDKVKNEVLNRLAVDVPVGPMMPEVAVQQLSKAEEAALRGARAPYRQLDLNQDVFRVAPDIANDLKKGLEPNIINALRSHTLPDGSPANLPLDFSTFGSTYPQAKLAMEKIQGIVGQKGEFPPFAGTQYGWFNQASGKFEPHVQTAVPTAAVMRVRNELNSLYKGAGPQDKIALNAIMKGFDQNMEDAIRNGLFSGNGAQVIGLMNQGRGMWKNYQNAFHGEGEADRIVSKAIDRMRDPSDPAGALQVAQGILNSNMIRTGAGKPGLGAEVYSKIESILGRNSPEMNSVREQLRSTLFNTGGRPMNLVNNIDNMLGPNNYQLATKLFTRDEMRNMRLTSRALKVLDKQQIPAKEANEKFGEIVSNNLGKIMLKGSVMAGSGVAGYMSQYPFGPLAGAAIGYGLTKGAEKLTGIGQRISREAATARELRGARPEPKPMLDLPKTSLYPSLLPTPATQLPYGYEENKRQGRATGGRVSDKLVNMVDRAKKNINNQTEELLKTPDSHVAQALEVANRHLED